jgi:ankyrin repeat protein
MFGEQERNLKWGILDRNEVRVRAALEAGADVNAKEYSGNSPSIFLAADNEMLDVCRWLVAAGADVNAKGERGSTALHVAVFKANIGMVELLLENGASPNAETDNGTVPLTVTGAHESLGICSLLMRFGADPGHLAKPYTAKAGLTPFQQAVKNGDIAAVRWYVLEHGQSVSQKTASGKTMIALSKGSEPMRDQLRALKTEVAVRAAVAFEAAGSEAPKSLVMAPL